MSPCTCVRREFVLNSVNVGVMAALFNVSSSWRCVRVFGVCLLPVSVMWCGHMQQQQGSVCGPCGEGGVLNSMNVRLMGTLCLL